MIVCTGGFGADFTADSLLAKHRPDLMHLPTTNGEHCTGDGIKMGMQIGAQTIDLEWVQVRLFLMGLTLNRLLVMLLLPPSSNMSKSSYM